MRMLMISPDTVAHARTAIAKARMNPVSAEEVAEFGTNKPLRGGVLKRTRRDIESLLSHTETIQISDGYTACITFEHQPDGGLCRHLSISVDGAPGTMPNPHAVRAIALLFEFELTDAAEVTNKFQLLQGADSVWIEEFRPGKRAINVLQLVRPKIEKMQ
jgi:hypothetical protein